MNLNICRNIRVSVLCETVTMVLPNSYYTFSKTVAKKDVAGFHKRYTHLLSLLSITVENKACSVTEELYIQTV